MRKAELFSRKDNSFLRMAGWMMTLLFCTCLGMANLQAQNVLFVKSGVTNGDVITVDGVSGKAYTTPQAAISASAVGDTIRLTEDYTGTSNVSITNRVLDGQGHTLTRSSGNNIYTKGATIMNLYIRNTSVSGKGIFMDGTMSGDVIIDNCDIDDVTYCIHRDGAIANPSYSLIIKNSSLKGWISWSDAFKSVIITNCTFGMGTSGYAHLRPYGSAVVEDCSFSSDFSVSTTNGPIADHAIIFNNCDIDGTPLTSANLNSLLENHNQEASNQKGVVVNGNFSQDANGEITGGIFGGNPESINSLCAPGYGPVALGTDPETYQVEPVYYVHFNAGGGTGTHGDSIVPRSAPTFTVPGNTQFSYGTYPFLNWNSKNYGEGTDIAVGSTMTLTSDTTLYAEWALDFVAKIGDNTFTTLQDAVDYANENLTGDVTIDLVKATSEIVKILQKDGISITLNGNDVTLTGQIFISSRQETPAYVGTYTAPNSVTIDNLNMKYDPAYYDNNGSTTESGLIYFCKNCAFGNVLNYSHNVTISNCDFDADGSNKSIYAISSIAGTVWNLKIENCTAKNALGLATLQSAPQFEVTGCSTEDVTYGIRIVNNNGPLTVTNNNFTADEVGIYVTGLTTGAVVNLSEDTVNAPKAFMLDPSCTNGTLDITSGKYIGEIDDNSTTDFFNISGGDYSKDVSGEPCAPGYAAFDNHDGTWTVTKAWFLYYDKNEAGASGTMDTVFVKQSDPDAGRTVEVAPCAFTWLPDHSFLAWNNKADGLGDTLRPGDNIILSSDTTLYVIWQLGYTVFYDNNGGAGSIPNQYKAVDETITLSDGTDGAGTYLFTRPDSTLYRWNTTPDEAVGSIDYALGAPYADNANLTLYAVWRLNLNMTMDSTDVVCYGENNGTDTVKIIGGEAPFQIVLSSTVMAENDTVKNLMDRTHIFTNLKPGKYNVQLTDVLKKDTIRGTFTVAQPDTLIVESMTVPVKPCPLMGTGFYNVSMTTTGGNGGNHFVWGEAAVNVDAMESTVIPGADDRDSTYTVAVKVTDKKGCVATDTTTFKVSPVIADDGTVHANSKLTIDTIRQGIMRGCDTVLRQFGTPHFTSTNPAITEDILDTIYNNIPTAFPDSVFYLGENKVIWTATDTCGHSITGEQVIIIYHYPCPNVTDVDNNEYPAVRLGCDCWMAENLKTTKYSDGRAISNLMKYESPTHPDAEANFAIYGYLYDWTAALDAEGGVTPDADGNVQGVCPTGWHMPTDLDFANVAGVQGRHDISDLRSTDYWLDGGGNNSTNFNLLPGGFYNDNTARYENILGEAYLWSVNSANPSQPKVFWADCHCYMWQVGNPSANMGASVRCVKD